MTGRRLYEIVTDEARAAGAHTLPYYEQDGKGGVDGLFTGRTPAAWAFLPRAEKALWNVAARRISKGRRT